MRYHTQFIRNPSPDEVRKLAEYVGKDRHRGGAVVDRSGLDLGEGDLGRWAEAASQDSLIRLHTISFAEPHPTDELVEAARAAAREHLPGRWIVGVHTSNPENDHVHIGQAGSSAELYMGQEDIERFRQDLARRVGEEIGDAEVSAGA